MGSEYMGPGYGPQRSPGQSSYEPTRETADEDTQPHNPAVSIPLYGDQQNNNYGYQAPYIAGGQNNNNGYQEPAYREHVTGPLPMYPSDASYLQRAYPGYPAAANGLPPGWYPGYMQPYPLPPKPKRDGYLLGISITAFVGSILVTLGGIASLCLLALFMAFGTYEHLKPDQQFAAIMELVAFTAAGLLGGGFSLFHSIRALFLQKPSSDFKLPWFWLFLLLYGVIIALAEALRSAGQAVTNIPLTALLIILSGALPALAAIALAVRRIHYPQQIRWPTSWRRFTLSMVTGATLAVVAALLLEFVLSAVTAQALHISNLQLDDPNAPLPNNLREISFFVLLVSVIAPLVEESVKPLAVVVLVGRVRSAAEAFVLGMAGGIGFALIETSGYIGIGYTDWVDVAIQRTSASLLHGLGAGMVGLGWYYMIHAHSLQRHRILIALSCWVYAVVQHAIWNGSSLLQAVPGPIGQYFATGNITLGVLSFPAFMLVYVLETALMLIVLFYVTKRLRPKLPLTPSSRQSAPQVQTPPQVQLQPPVRAYYAPMR